MLKTLQRRHPGWRAAALAMGVLGMIGGLGLSGRAFAREFCVVCTEPQMTYRCALDGAGGFEGSQQLACIKTLAAEGQHATCALRKSGPSDACAGELRRVSAASLVPLATVPEPDAKAPQGDAPETVADAVKKMGSTATKQMDKTGDQIKRGTEATTTAVQRTFSCIASLFTNCGAP